MVDPTETRNLAADLSIGGFAVVRELGRGAMGTVYLARQTSLDRLVALKVLKADLARDDDFRERFTAEAKMAAKLQHEHVVSVIDAGRDARLGVYYIAMEYVPGQTLEERATKAGRLSEVETLEVGRAVARALQFGENRGVVHRDVKPDNILIGPDGVTKLSDLGLAKVVNQGGTGRTSVGVVLGTPLYMAPEQAMGVSDLDTRADLYALGLVLWRCLTGQVPFDPDGKGQTMEILSRHLDQEVPDLRTVAPEVSEPTAKLVAWLCARDRDQRYPTAAAAVEDFNRVLNEEVPKGPHGTRASTRYAAANMPTHRISSEDLQKAGLAQPDPPPPSEAETVRTEALAPPAADPTSTPTQLQTLVRVLAVAVIVLAVTAAGLLWLLNTRSRPAPRPPVPPVDRPPPEPSAEQEVLLRVRALREVLERDLADVPARAAQTQAWISRADLTAADLRAAERAVGWSIAAHRWAESGADPDELLALLASGSVDGERPMAQAARALHSDLQGLARACAKVRELVGQRPETRQVWLRMYVASAQAEGADVDDWRRGPYDLVRLTVLIDAWPGVTPTNRAAQAEGLEPDTLRDRLQRRLSYRALTAQWSAPLAIWERLDPDDSSLTHALSHADPESAFVAERLQRVTPPQLGDRDAWGVSWVYRGPATLTWGRARLDVEDHGILLDDRRHDIDWIHPGVNLILELFRAEYEWQLSVSTLDRTRSHSITLDDYWGPARIRWVEGEAVDTLLRAGFGGN